MRVAFAACDVSVAYGEQVVLERASAEFAAGRMTAVIGPNGAGKSTLIKAAFGLVPTLGGTFELYGAPFRGHDPRVAYLPQRESVDWDFPVSVRDVVLMGTYGRVRWFGRPGKAENDAARHAIAAVGLEGLEGRQIGALSGGQQQRVFLARALAQQAEVFVMDEPFAGVDTATENAITEVLRDLAGQGKTVVAVHHDLISVRERFDEVVLLNRRVVAAGQAEEAMTEAHLREAYGARWASVGLG